MNKENCKLWCDTLKTTDKKQGRLYLKHGDEYCCLGIAAELAGLKQEEIENTIFWNHNSYRKVEEFLGFDSDQIVKSAGLMGGEFHIDKVTESLVDWNDSLRLSFKEIAEKFEKEYLNKE